MLLTAMSVTAGITVTVAKRWLLLALSSLRVCLPTKTWLPADLGVHAKQLAAADVISKPFDLAELLPKITRVASAA